MINGRLLPRDKYDTDAATKLVALEWEMIEPVMPQILEWCQDRNWPVAVVFQPFLANVGVRLLPFVRTVFATDDDIWKYNILVDIVGQSTALATALRADLERMANHPSSGERLEGVAEEAQAILAS